MSARSSLAKDDVIHAIFMEIPSSGDIESERRTAARIYQRVFVPLLMIDEEEADRILAHWESRTCSICGLPLNKDGCCISRCGADKTA